MTDRFCCIEAKKLLSWMLHDLKRGELFGIDQGLFFLPEAGQPYRMERYGKVLETPLGVAAGPHTQLAQNILAAWLCGGRYMELKTIQVLDELEVTKPCIDMADEGYNCEWSQELKLDQSYNEYLKAYVLLHVLRHMLGLPAEAAPGKGPGFIFNMSAGYNLEGILSLTVQRFLDRMADATDDIARLKDELAPLYPAIRDLPMHPCISDSLTVSTMHGCPPDEVEKIGHYFVTERRLNTTIKLNPTLLGAERLRYILNERMGFATVVPDIAFEHDLKYPDGVKLVRNLTAAAAEAGVAFGVKLTNTLETSNKQQNLPKKEPMVYMSGRALHPVSINLAERLQQEFAGKLDISFSAGADCFNIADVLACGLRPVTVCSDLLKPGGYGRLRQYLDTLCLTMRELHAADLPGLAAAKAPDALDPALSWLVTYAANVLAEHSRYRKDVFGYQTVKSARPLPRFDCAAAPCVATCPTGQEVPRYMEAVAHGDFERAWKIILATNPLPNVQGMVCDHACQSHCTRINYDTPLMIREIKRFVADQFKTSGTGLVPAAANGLKAAIIGAGPSGLSAAHFLALAGVEVSLYEAKNFPGGMASDAIPAFRLSDDALTRDMQAIFDLGVTFHPNTRVTTEMFDNLRKLNHMVYVSVGAQKSLGLGIPGEDAKGVLDQLSFLSAVRRGQRPRLGQRVLVIGGGNSAMDVARTAKRLVGETGEVTLVYRRTRKEMPADHEELIGAVEEGVRIHELVAPEAVETANGVMTGLKVCAMRLVEDEAGGRPRPVRQEGAFSVLPADTLIVAIGQKVNLDFVPGGQLAVDPVRHSTALPGVWAGGDALRGASSLINAIGDGRRVAEAFLLARGVALPQVAPADTRSPDLHNLRVCQARRHSGPCLPEKSPAARLNFDLFVDTLSEAHAKQEAHRCLQCDLVCNVCATVCPNRANIALRSMPFSLPVQRATATASGVTIETMAVKKVSQAFQIVNLADACNECGNCAAFCPSSGAPYKDKPRVHLTRAVFENAPEGFYLAHPLLLEARYAGRPATLEKVTGGFLYEDESLTAELNAATFAATRVVLKEGCQSATLDRAVEMAMLHTLLAMRQPFKE